MKGSRAEIEVDSAGERAALGRLPLIVAAIPVAIVVGFYVGGPGLGMAVAGLTAALIVVVAIRQAPRLPIVPPAAGDGRAHMLLVAREPLESGITIDRVIEAAGVEDHEAAGVDAEVLVLAPHRPRFTERWASDVDRGRQRAQDCLVLTVASLAKAGIDATARVGDEDLVQAVDDQLRSYPATQVVLVDGPEGGPAASATARQLQSRLRVPFLRLIDSERDPRPTRV